MPRNQGISFPFSVSVIGAAPPMAPTPDSADTASPGLITCVPGLSFQAQRSEIVKVGWGAGKAFKGMTSNHNDVEQRLRENLRLRHQLAEEIGKAAEPVTFSHKVDKWWRFGRADDQPLILALLLVFIAITLYFFL
jgi:hypothetical protein